MDENKRKPTLAEMILAGYGVTELLLLFAAWIDLGSKNFNVPFPDGVVLFMANSLFLGIALENALYSNPPNHEHHPH